MFIHSGVFLDPIPYPILSYPKKNLYDYQQNVLKFQRINTNISLL